jgi:hypothetical protein
MTLEDIRRHFKQWNGEEIGRVMGDDGEVRCILDFPKT